MTSERPPLLLIHGFTDTGRTWDALRPHLAEHFELIVPTLVGHHGGPPLPAGMTDPLAAMADELERELDRAGARRATIVGNSLGGWLAFALAARDRATSVLALSPAYGWPEDQPPDHTRRQFARAQRMAPVGARLVRHVTARALSRRLAFAEVIAHPERVPPSTAAELIRGAADCPMFEPLNAFMEAGHYRDAWTHFDVPTVIAWGTHDRTIPARSCSAWFRQRLPDAQWIELPDCGHLPQHDDPELVASIVLELAGAGAARPATANAPVREPVTA